jgi:hypothetical protein
LIIEASNAIVTHSDAACDLYRPHYRNYHKLKLSIKKNFAPAGLSGDSLYITAGDELYFRVRTVREKERQCY